MTDASGIPLLSAGFVATAKVVLALAGAGLAAAEIALARSGRASERRALRTGLWIALAIASIAIWTRLAPLRGGPQLHVWELFHHVLGAKYVDELGYTLLYDCTLVADVEAGFEIAPAARPVRRLATNRVERGDAVLAGASAACHERFDAARWHAFSHDVAVLRSLVAPRQWATMTLDHGMNAPPVWTIAGATLASAAPISPTTLRWLTALDTALLAAMTLAWAWAFGVRTTAIAWIALGTFYFADYRWIGGAFLRFDWLALSAIGIALLQRGCAIAAGFALTWATGVRIFPGFLVAAVVLHAGLDLVRTRRLSPAHGRFATGCLLAIATLGPLSVRVAGSDAWPAFVANSRKHLSTPLLNFAGWKTVVAYDPAKTADALRDVARDDPFEPWHEAVRATFERRRVAFAAGLLGFVVLLAAALRRAPIAAAPVLGIGLVIFAGEIGSYYYALLALYAALAVHVPIAPVLLLVASAASHAAASAVSSSQDVVSIAVSAVAMALAVALTACVWRRGAEPPAPP